PHRRIHRLRRSGKSGARHRPHVSASRHRDRGASQAGRTLRAWRSRLRSGSARERSARCDSRGAGRDRRPPNDIRRHWAHIERRATPLSRPHSCRRPCWPAVDRRRPGAVRGDAAMTSLPLARIEATTERLYALLPAHIRTVDAANGWTLKALIEVLAAGSAEIDREIDT